MEQAVAGKMQESIRYDAPRGKGAAAPRKDRYRRELYEPPSARKIAYAAPPPKTDGSEYHPQAPLKTLTPAEIRAIIVVVAVVTAVAVGIILLAAEAASTQKDINNIKRGIAQVDDDIANLRIEIEQSQNMQIIKNRAQEELGLKAPSFDQYVYVSELAEPQSDFGRYIKERAYGGTRSPAAGAPEE